MGEGRVCMLSVPGYCLLLYFIQRDDNVKVTKRTQWRLLFLTRGLEGNCQGMKAVRM